MSPTAAPPTPQEIQRKLSVHSVSRQKPSTLTTALVSGTESDSDSILTPDMPSPSTHPQPPLSSIAERRSDSGDDTDDDDEPVEPGGWKTADIHSHKQRNSVDESVIKAGYLWKKGERRKTWKKRWFVLRPAHLAYYKSSAEYQLLRLLELSDVHSCTPVNLKRHTNTFGLISPTRTFYLQAANPNEVQQWVKAIEEARQTLLATSTQTSAPVPIPIPQSSKEVIPAARSVSRGSIPHSVSPPQASYGHQAFTSSDSEDAMPPTSSSPSNYTSPTQPAKALSPSKSTGPQKDPAKVILSGYLMKCGSKRRNWRKRWFVLSGEKLVYSGSHMDTKPHRQFAFNDILDALEYDLPNHSQKAPVTPSVPAPPQGSPDGVDINPTHTFKIVTTKRTLLLCAPSEDDEIKWLGAVRALIARRAEKGEVPGAAGGVQEVVSTVATSGSGSSGLRSKVRRLSGAGDEGRQ